MKEIFYCTLLCISANNSIAQNVGIGTVSPLAKLHVVKNDSAVALFENTQALNTNISTALYFKTGNSALPYTGAIKTIGDGTNVARLGLFTFTSASGNNLKERMSITDAGNVGIGIVNPQSNLHINPNGAGSLLIGTNRASGGYTNLEMGINAQSNGYGYVQATKAAGSSYGALALNANGGNVGVGTNTPTNTLDVHGGVAFPIKVVTNNYTVQSDDYTIAVDMQENVNKPTVKIFLPPTLLNHGRIINVIAINMASDNASPGNTNSVEVYDATGTILYQKLQRWERNELSPGFHTVRFVLGFVFQCIGATTWVTLSKNSTEYRFPT
ncbi:hypothetical protein [Ferruginibacter sp.]|nr:hypothetical protein [Ferruginibacter sp.]